MAGKVPDDLDWIVHVDILTTHDQDGFLRSLQHLQTAFSTLPAPAHRRKHALYDSSL